MMRQNSDVANGTDRLESLSDNIFAVAMTLLIVNIKVPQNHEIVGKTHVWPLVVPLWHHLRAFGLSFFIIGLFWIAHHRVFALIRRSDTTLQIVNLVFMGFTVLTPFSAGLLGQFDESRIALIIYGANIIAISLALQTAWWYATFRRTFVCPEIGLGEIRRHTARNLAVSGVCIAAIAASFFDTKIGLWIYLLSPLSFFWPHVRPTDA